MQPDSLWAASGAALLGLGLRGLWSHRPAFVVPDAELVAVRARVVRSGVQVGRGGRRTGWIDWDVPSNPSMHRWVRDVAPDPDEAFVRTFAPGTDHALWHQRGRYGRNFFCCRTKKNSSADHSVDRTRVPLRPSYIDALWVFLYTVMVLVGIGALRRACCARQ